MSFAKKLEYLSARRMLVFFSQEDGSTDYICNIMIVKRSPVKGVGRSVDEAFEEAFDRAVFKTEGVKLVKSAAADSATTNEITSLSVCAN